MPTKIKESNKTSPAKMLPVSPDLIAKGAIGALAGGASGAMGEIGQIKNEFQEKDYRSQKFGKKLKMLGGAGLRTFGAYQQGMLGGLAQGTVGTDFGLGSMGMLGDNNPQATIPGAPGMPGGENIAQNSSAGGNPVFDPANENTINNVMGPTDTYGSLFT